MVAEGRTEAALRELEALSKEFPDDPEILARIGEIHRRNDDPTMAAFYFEQAYRQAPGDTALLYDAYRMQRAADQTKAAAELLAELAEASPETMTPEMWVRLGRHRADAGRTRPALDALLKGLNPDEERPAAEDAVTVGELFLEAGNLPQADRWFGIAVEQDDPNALPALFGLLEIAIRQKKWRAAEDVIEQLDTRFPGALDASEWADARSEIEQWRAAREKMRTTLDGESDDSDEGDRNTGENEADTGRADADTGESGESTGTADASDTSVASADKAETTGEAGEAGATEARDPAAAAADRVSGKSETVEDIERMRAMADQPAVEQTPDDPYAKDAASAGSSDATGTDITFDPDIPVQPADPDLSFRVSFDEQNNGAEVDYSVRSRSRARTSGDPLANAFEEASESVLREELDAPARDTDTPRAADASPTRSPKSLDELLADAEAALTRRDYGTAIRAFWRALGRENDRPDIWNRLSRAYLANDQAENAETTALEATRLAPSEPEYMLDYLRVIQKTKKPSDFMAELETAHDRFPRNPEITLSLARAYERVRGNRPAARSMYRRFLDIAPNHPLSPEAESALARLR